MAAVAAARLCFRSCSNTGAMYVRVCAEVFRDRAKTKTLRECALT